MKKMRMLIANDDGIDSPFLPGFARAMSQIADIEIVVPAYEQSWIGRAYSRHSELVVKERDFMGHKCCAVTGTPSDCVNLALAHLCEETPDVVVSGLNIGQNVAMPLLWSSGTFSAAVEAAGWGIPAFAFSMRLEKKYYEACRLRHEMPDEELERRVREASEKSAEYVMEVMGSHKFADGEVRNVNFPALYAKDTPFEKCVPARVKLASLYVKNQAGNYDFSYAMGEASPSKEPTDLELLNAGMACHCKIDIKF